MIKAAFPKTVFAACLLAIAATGCDRSKQETPAVSSSFEATTLLEYIPADTPYVFAVLQPLPDDVADKLEPKVNAILRSYQGVLRTVITRTGAAESGAEGAVPDDNAALLTEVSSLLSVDGLRSAGIDRHSKMVLYGAGLLPVMRMTLSDGKLMDAAIARIEAKANQGLSTGSVDGQVYRYVGDDQGRIVFAVIGDQFVLSLVPASLSDDLLKTVLGMTLPAASIAGTDRLQKVIDTNGFRPYSIGLIDVEGIVATFLGDQTGANAELLRLVNYDNKQLSDTCKAEIREVAGIAPRIVTGYTDISTAKFTSNTVLELRSDIAAGLARLPTPVPGLGSEQGGLFAFGMSLDMLAAREFFESRLDAMETDPFQCELFADLQAGVANGRAALKQPIPPIAYGFKGFLAVVEDIAGMDLANNQPPTSADFRLLVSTDNAAGLLAMGAMFSPEIAALDIRPDGVPVKFESPNLAGFTDAAYVAMTENALALSVGAGIEARLSAMLSASAGKPPPFMSMEMDAARYYEFIAQAAAMKHDEQVQTPPELQKAISEMMTVVGDLISRMTFDVRFTEHGVEFPSTVTFAD